MPMYHIQSMPRKNWYKTTNSHMGDSILKCTFCSFLKLLICPQDIQILIAVYLKFVTNYIFLISIDEFSFFLSSYLTDMQNPTVIFEINDICKIITSHSWDLWCMFAHKIHYSTLNYNYLCFLFILIILKHVFLMNTKDGFQM